MGRVLFFLFCHVISAYALAMPISEVHDADLEPNPELVQAERLLKISPKQALNKLNRFIDAPSRSLTASNSVRKLSLEYVKQSRHDMFQALLLKSQAQNMTAHVCSALKTLDHAMLLAKKYNNINMQVEIILMQAKLRWEQNNNPRFALQVLSQAIVTENMSSLPVDLRMEYQLLIAATYLERLPSQQKQTDIPQIKIHLETANKLLDQVNKARLKIKYYLLESQFYMLKEQRSVTQQALLTAMGLAIANHEYDLVADAQLLLATFYTSYHGYSIALNYVTQAANFYENTGQKSKLASALKLIGHIYSYQERPNMALVNYLNAMDMAYSTTNPGRLIDLKLGIAFVYLQLDELKKADDYINKVENVIASEPRFAALHPVYMLLKGEYLLRNNKNKTAIDFINNGLKEIPTYNLQLRKYAHSLLIKAYNNMGIPSKENVYLQRMNSILEKIRLQQMEFNTETLIQHEQLIEKINANHDLQAKYTTLDKQYLRSSNLNQLLLCGIIIIALALGYFITINSANNAALRRNRNIRYNHSRTHLYNNHKVNATLPAYLKGTLRLCEQKLNDQQYDVLDDTIFNGLRLKLALINLSWLTELRSRPDFSYLSIEKIENDLGEYLQATLGESGKLYQLNDSSFLYIEAYGVSPSPESFAQHVLQQCEQFSNYQAPLGKISVGACYYPLLPRAVSGVSLSELLNVLQLAQTAAAQLNKQYEKNNWVMFSPISTATSACFQGDLYVACLDAIRRGVIKVLHSDTPHPVDWNSILTQYPAPTHNPEI